MNLEEQNRIIQDLMESDKEYVIYGTGSGAAKLVASLGYFYSKIAFFIDSNKKRGDFCGKSVKHVSEVNFNRIAGIIIASQYYNEILNVISKYTSIDQLQIYYPYKQSEKNERLKNKCGRYTYGINDQTVENEEFLESVGSFCSINHTASIGTLGNHPLDLITTSNFLYSPFWGIVEEYNYELRAKYNSPIIIENDVWIGHNVIILPGVKIHNGAIVGAGAVVTKDIPPYAIVGGVPAKVIRYRFEPHIIEALLEIKWWEWDDDKIKDNFDLFFDPEEFIKVHYKAGANDR